MTRQEITTELAVNGAYLKCLNDLQNFIGAYVDKYKTSPSALQINERFIVPGIKSVEEKSKEIGKEIQTLNN